MSQNKKESQSPAQRSWSSAMMRANVLLLANVILAAGVVVLAIDNASQDVEVRLVPAEIHDEMWIRKNEASETYKAGWALMIADMLGNVGPRNIDLRVEQLPNYLSPRLRAELEQQIVEQAANIKARGIQNIFELDDIQYDRLKDRFFVWGTKRTFVKGTATANTAYTYEMKIEIHNGRPRIVEFATYPGTPAQRPKEMGADGKPKDPKAIEWLPYLSDEMRAVINEQPAAGKEK